MHTTHTTQPRFDTTALRRTALLECLKHQHLAGRFGDGPTGPQLQRLCARSLCDVDVERFRWCRVERSQSIGKGPNGFGNEKQRDASRGSRRKWRLEGAAIAGTFPPATGAIPRFAHSRRNAPRARDTILVEPGHWAGKMRRDRRRHHRSDFFVEAIRNDRLLRSAATVVERIFLPWRAATIGDGTNGRRRRRGGVALFRRGRFRFQGLRDG